MKLANLFLLTLAAFGLATQAHAQCSDSALNGTLFYELGGSVAKTGGGTASHEEIGEVTADGNGNLTGSTTTSIAGVTTTLPVTGTYTINANCAGNGELVTTANTVDFAIELVNGGGQSQISVTTSTAGEIAQGHFYRAANATGGVCATGTLSGAYAMLLSGGTYTGATRTAYNAAVQATFDGNGGLNFAGEVTSGVTTGASLSGTGTYTLNADCSGTAQVAAGLFGTLNYQIARIAGGEVLFLETDANTTISGIANGQLNEDIIPQIAFGGGWYTALYFTNNSGVAVSFLVTFTADDGTPLNIPGTGTTATVTLQPQQTQIIEALNSGTLTQGYATFNPPTGVTGYGVFRQSVPGRFDQEALAGFKDAMSTTSTFTFDDTTYTTALSFANPGASAITATVTAWDNTGTLLGTGTVNLNPAHKSALSMRTISGLSGIAGQRGSAQVTVNSGNVAVLALRFSGSAFTSIPTTQQ